MVDNFFLNFFSEWLALLCYRIYQAQKVLRNHEDRKYFFNLSLALSMLLIGVGLFFSGLAHYYGRSRLQEVYYRLMLFFMEVT